MEGTWEECRSEPIPTSQWVGIPHVDWKVGGCICSVLFVTCNCNSFELQQQIDNLEQAETLMLSNVSYWDNLVRPGNNKQCQKQSSFYNMCFLPPMLKVSFSPLVADQFSSNCNDVVLLRSKSFLIFIPEEVSAETSVCDGYFPVSKSKL